MINNSSTIGKSPDVTDQKQTNSQPSKGKWTKLAMLAIAGLMALGLAGCDPGKYTGGGFINSAAGGKQKATFGFNFEAVDRDGDGQIDQMVEAYDPSDPDTFYVAWWLGKGQFDYNDQAAGVKFHFDCDLTLALDANREVESSVSFRFDPPTSFPFNPADLVFTGMEFDGQYTSAAGKGRVSVLLTAKGDSFGSAEDTIEVTLSGGPYDGYHNSGTIKGGNIQWHPAKSK